MKDPNSDEKNEQLNATEHSPPTPIPKFNHSYACECHGCGFGCGCASKCSCGEYHRPVKRVGPDFVHIGDGSIHIHLSSP
ncbi:hypothetical protein VTP01DRAFT_1520 [Rhizomucor pusillus]|uniref:uncharacterized protein n=1 Tax=Rhizomucor pusillus TaxID=4840 RepID=UPI0037440B6D